MEIDKQRIEDAIIQQVSQDIISDESLWNNAKRAFDARVEKLWSEVAEERIRSQIELIIAEGFEREYCKVDSFGQQKGQKTTIRAELEKLISGYWNTTVDKNGKPDTGTYGDKVTRAEWMMMQIVADDFKGNMKQHVINIGGALKDHLRKELHETTNRLLHDVFHVKSIDDQAKNGPGRSCIDPPAKPVA